jgi:hypothetical protein
MAESARERRMFTAYVGKEGQVRQRWKEFRRELQLNDDEVKIMRRQYQHSMKQN